MPTGIVLEVPVAANSIEFYKIDKEGPGKLVCTAEQIYLDSTDNKIN